MPTMPFRHAGERIEPPVSEPIDMKQRRAATAAPEPPLEPPGMCSWFHALRQVPKCGLFVVEPKANSCMLFLPTITAPASLSFAVTTASAAGTASLKMREPLVVTTPAVLKRSFNPMGTPWSAPRQRPAAISASARRAAAMA